MAAMAAHRRAKMWESAAWAVLKCERPDMGAGASALRMMSEAVKSVCIEVVAQKSGVSSAQSRDSGAAPTGLAMEAAVRRVFAPCHQGQILAASVGQPPPLEDVMQAVAQQWPEMAPQTAQSLAACAAEALSLLVRPATEIADERHAKASVLDGCLFLQDLKHAMDAEPELAMLFRGSVPLPSDMS